MSQFWSDVLHPHLLGLDHVDAGTNSSPLRASPKVNIRSAALVEKHVPEYRRWRSF